MTRDEKRQKLESFGRGPALLSAALRKFPKKMWIYRPSPDRWSIHEIIQHLADREAIGYVQYRGFIAEPGSRALEFNASRWVDSLGYFHQSTSEALELLRRLRKASYWLLASLPESAWTDSPENSYNTRTNLGCWLDREERHIHRHIEQMQQNYECWFNQHPPRRTAPRAAPNVHVTKPQARTQTALSLDALEGATPPVALSLVKI